MDRSRAATPQFGACSANASPSTSGFSQAQTLIEALEALPATAGRGFRFRSLDGSERQFQWQELAREARRRGALLLAAGLRKGDRVALVVAEADEFVLTFLGAVVAGIVPVPMYPRSSFKARNAYVDTVLHILTAASARALITDATTQPAIQAVLERGSGTRLEWCWTVQQLFATDAEPAASALFPRIEPSDLCFLQFTSGSTAKPKGVMVSHRNLMANTSAFLGPAGADRRDDDITVTWLPLFHDMGLIGFVLGTLIHDIPTVLLPTDAFARRPTLWMQAMHDYAGTITFAPNFAYALAAKRTRDKDLEGLDLSKIRIAGCGAEPISAKVLRAFAERFGRAGFRANALMPAYGMAEATLAISFHPHGTPMVTDRVSAAALRQGKALPVSPEEPSLELVACGPSFPLHAIRIVDECGRALPEREVGEILAAGPSNTAGYYQNPAATAESHRDGWLHTGDLGYLAEGRLYVCGRLKDLIIIRGANYHPQDIEWSVADLPGLRRDNVIAFGARAADEEALVIAAEGNASDAEDLRKAIALRINESFGLVVGHVAIVRVGSLPKTSSGKLQRRRAKELFEQGLLEEHTR